MFFIRFKCNERLQIFIIIGISAYLFYHLVIFIDLKFNIYDVKAYSMTCRNTY